MRAFVCWYLVVELCGLLTVPLAWRVFHCLPDRGFGLSKILGVLLVGTALWLGTASGVLRNEVGGAALALLGVGLASLLVGWPRLRRSRRGTSPLIAWVHSHMVHVVVVEALFFLAFVAWASVRAHMPAANHTEQPMDLLFLTAVSTSPTFPPRDPWLAGYPISYYYLGYWLLGTLGHLAGQPSEIAYNLGQACWFALLISGCYSLGWNLAALAAPRPGGRTGWGLVLGGVVTAVTVALTSNVQGLVAGMNASSRVVGRLLAPSGSADHAGHAAGESSWWWWGSSRVLRDLDLSGRPLEVIDEFPAFSYLLGDNHPHVLAMPLALLVLSLALNLFLAGRARTRWTLGRQRRHTLLGAVPLGLTGLAVVVIAAGALLATNPWDFPAAWLILVLACVAASTASSGSPRPARHPAISLALVVALGAAVLAVPYLLSAQNNVQGIRPNLFHPTAPLQLLSMFGSFIPAMAALLWLGCRDRPPSWRRLGWFVTVALALSVAWLTAGAAWAHWTEAGRQWLTGMAAPPGIRSHVSFILERWGERWPTLALLATLDAMLWALVWGRSATLKAGPGMGGDPALRFSLMLAAVGVGLVLVPELAYVADSFGTRMNTVFKLYYQAWLLLGVGASYASVAAIRSSGRIKAVGTASVLLVLAGTTYLGAGVQSRLASGPSTRTTLDALAYLESTDPDELSAIRWVRRHTRPDARVVQGAGTSYRADHCRISVATGRPTLLGWVGHELQWRGAAFSTQAAGRDAALSEIYGGGEYQALRQLLDAWAVDYVYVSPRERSLYGMTPNAEERLRTVMEPAFESGEVRIYRRRG